MTAQSERWVAEDAQRERVSNLDLGLLVAKLTITSGALLEKQQWISDGKEDPETYLRSSEACVRELRSELDQWLTKNFGGAS